MFLTPKTAGPVASGRREKSDHASLDDAKNAFAQHPHRFEYEALIYVDGTPTWIGSTDWNGRVDWQPWKV